MLLSPQTRAKVELYKRQDFSSLGLSPKQEEALRELHPKNTETRVLTYGGGAGGGKSWFICVWEILNALAYANTKQYISRNELKRLMSSTYVTFMKVALTFDLVQGVHWSLNGKYNYIEFANGSRIDLVDVSYQPRDPMFERFGSIEYTCGANEEAGEIDFGAFDILFTRTGRHLNRELGFYPKNLNTANPKKNWLYQYFYKPFMSDTLEKGYYFIQALIHDNKFIDPEYIKSLENTKDEVKKQRLLYGNWEYDDDDAILIPYQNIIKAFENTSVQPTGRRYISCDIAMEGADKMVAVVFDGLVLEKVYTWAKTNGKEVIQKIQEVALKWNVPQSNIVYDASGVGNYLGGFLGGAVSFSGSSSPKNGPNYQNLRAQAFFRLSEMINQGEIYLKDQEFKTEICEELGVIKSMLDTPKSSIISKAEMKKTLGHSPDYADALSMFMVYHLSEVANSFHSDWF